jgi:hypothetical protein
MQSLTFVRPGVAVDTCRRTNTDDSISPVRSLACRVTTQPRSAVVTRRTEPAVARDFAQFGEFRLSDGVPGSSSRPD